VGLMTEVPKYPVRGLVAPAAPMSRVLSGAASKKPEELILKQLAVPCAHAWNTSCVVLAPVDSWNSGPVRWIRWR